MTPPPIHRPPPVDGLLDAAPLRDGIRLATWTITGYVHGAARKKSTTAQRAFSGLTLLGAIALAPALYVAMPVMIAARRNTRYYMAPDRMATIALTAKHGVWRVADHATAQPGTRRGWKLRRALVPQLIHTLDRDGIVLEAAAVTPKRADDYIRDVPGLVDIGRAWPRGRKLRRLPQPAPAVDERDGEGTL